jgi:hypothetical protein
MGGRAAWMVLMVVLLTGATAAAKTDEGSTGTCIDRTIVPDSMRPVGCDMSKALATGMAHSPAFRGLVARIDRLGGIVYLLPGPVVQPEARRVLTGALLHRVSRSGSRRVLWIKVLPESGDRVVITLAHELQHAVELLESDATTEAEIDALFDRIGTRTGAWTSETLAATDVERIVRRELLASR